MARSCVAPAGEKRLSTRRGFFLVCPSTCTDAHHEDDSPCEPACDPQEPEDW
jgi:hypothetical protein